MTHPVSSARRSERGWRRELLARTALCGALVSLSGLLWAPAQAAPVLGSTEVSAGGAAPVLAVSGGATNVTLRAPRTIINWSGFDVADGESVNYSFDARNWIVLNKLGAFAPANINGSITGKVAGAAGGNIWFAAPGGMIFGAGAQIDAGGLLISSATPDSASFLDPAKLQFSFADGEYYGSNAIALNNGSKLTSHGGLLAVIGSNVVSEADTAVSGQGGGSVLYGAAAGYTLRLAQTAANDFDLLDFIVPSSGLGSTNPVAIDLQGATNGNSVFVAVVSHTSFATAVINLEGMITATSAAVDGGDVVLSGGGGIVGRLPGTHLTGGVDTDLYLNVASASRDVQVKNSGQIFGKPWLRPSKQPPIQNPPSGNGFRSCNFSACTALLYLDEKAPFLLSGADASIVSNVTAGRDVTLSATANVDIGLARAGRDLTAEGASLVANSLGATGTLSVKANAGNLKVADAGAGGTTSLAATGDISIDTLGLIGPSTQKATLSSGQDVFLGAGSFGGAGSVDITAARTITVDAAQAKLETLTAGGAAILRGGGLNIGSVRAAVVQARAESVKIGAAVSTGDLYVFSTNGDAIVGQATSGDDIYVDATNGTASLANATIAGLGPDNVGLNFQGNTDTTDNGRVVSVSSTQDAKLGLGIGSMTGATVVSVQATQDAIVDVVGAPPGTFSMSAGRDATFKAPTVSFSQVSAGRDLSLITTVGDFTVANSLVATRSITLGAAGALRTSDVRADSGSITLTGRTLTAGTLNAALDLTLKATGGGVAVTSYRAGRDLVLQGSSFSLGSALAPVGRDLSITAAGDFSITQDLSAVGKISFDVQGKATVANVTAVSFQVLANDLDLTGTLSAPTIQIESRSGAFRLGGGATDGTPASGLWLDNAEFGRLRASSSVNLYAGSFAGTARGDLTVLNLTVNPALTPGVNLFAAGVQNLLVQGVVAPTASGGAFRIGDTGTGPWRPNSILVTGSIGSAVFDSGAYTGVRAFDEVRLHAQNDILLGSQRFIALIQQTAVPDIDIGSGKPVGAAPTAAEQFHVFTVAGRLEVSADGKVVQQNTAPTLSSPVGVLITSKGSPDLVIDPPKIVQLFGSVIDSTGKLVTSFGAGSAITVAVVGPTGAPISAPAGASYTFNTCSVGTSLCSGAAVGAASGSSGSVADSAGSVSLSLSQTAPISNASDGDSGDAAAEAASLATPAPPLLAVAPVDLKEIVTDPVTTGAGSEEIWRKNRAKTK